MRLALGLFVLVLLAPPAAAQSIAARYAIPCTPRPEFVRQLRAHVREPDRVELALTQFSIAATREAETSHWNVVVQRAGDDEPRSLRDVSCGAVSAGAAVLVSAWIDETLPESDAGQQVAVEPSTPPPAPTPALEDDAGSAKFGASLVLDEVYGIAHSRAPGATLEFWHSDHYSSIALSASFWPGSIGVPASIEHDRYARPILELGLSTAILFMDFGRVHLGPWIAAHGGWKPSVAAPDQKLTLRISAAVQLQWDSGPWFVFGRVGLAYLRSEVSLATLAALGAGVALF